MPLKVDLSRLRAKLLAARTPSRVQCVCVRVCLQAEVEVLFDPEIAAVAHVAGLDVRLVCHHC